LAPDVLSLVSTFIDGLVSASQWTPLDVLVAPFIPEVQADALLNLKGADPFPGPPVEVNSPTWTEKLGYTFNGSNNYVNETFAPSISGTNFQNNNCSFGCFIPSHPGASGGGKSGCVDGTANHALAIIPRLTDSGPNGNISQAATFTTTFPATNGVGFFCVDRSTSTAANFLKNGVQATQQGNLAGGLSTQSIYIGAFNNNGAAANFHNAQYAAWCLSNHRTAANWVSIYNLLQAAYDARQLTA
ncbi:MAG: hypothetical protein ACREMY_18520, partial [bacterium]